MVTETLDSQALVKEAQSRAELSDFGDTAFMEPFEVLVKSLNTESNLSAAGYEMQRERLTSILVNRLQTEYWYQKHPEISQEKLDNPVVIVGLPRTGTTMLHRIMASDSRFYAPLWYEVRGPAPRPGWDFVSTDERIVAAEAEVKYMLDNSPDLAAIHPMDAQGADEEIMLLEHAFYSAVPEAYSNVPSYTAWIKSHDNTPGYQYLKKLLQLLQWQKKRCGINAQRWLLKTPHHLQQMAVLFKVFPEAQIIQTHRDPVQTIPSYASFIYALWILCSEEVDTKRIGELWGELLADGMRHTEAVRAQYPERFLDLWYRDTLKEPISVIEGAYEFIGIPLTDEARQAMNEWRKENPREARPPHIYKGSTFGYTDEGIKQAFYDYRQNHIVGREGVSADD